MDAGKLLDLWGFATYLLKTKGWEQEHRYHMEYDDLEVVLFPGDRILTEGTAQHILWMIKELRRRKGI